MDGEQLVGQGVSPGEWEQWMGNSWWDRELVLGNENSGRGTAGGTGS